MKSTGRYRKKHHRAGRREKWSEQDKETHDPIYDIELYADQAGCPANVMIMGAEVWRTLRSFKKFRELYDLSRGSESAAELACKTWAKW